MASSEILIPIARRAWCRAHVRRFNLESRDAAYLAQMRNISDYARTLLGRQPPRTKGGADASAQTAQGFVLCVCMRVCVCVRACVCVQ